MNPLDRHKKELHCPSMVFRTDPWNLGHVGWSVDQLEAYRRIQGGRWMVKKVDFGSG